MQYSKSDFSINGNGSNKKVYLLIRKGSNAARRCRSDNIENWVIPAVVTNVGRRFITVTIEQTQTVVKFDMQENFQQVYNCGGPDYILFKSKQDAYDSMEADRLYRLLYTQINACMPNRYTAKQLKEVCRTLGIDYKT